MKPFPSASTLLLTASLLTFSAHAFDSTNRGYNDPVWGTGEESETTPDEYRHFDNDMNGPTKRSILDYLQQKKKRAEERMALIDEEIACIEQSAEESDAFWHCYQLAQQKKNRMKQRHQSQRAFPSRRSRYQGNNGMPTFDRMGMGMMPMPW